MITEKKLKTKFKSNSEDAFKTLFSTYFDLLYGFVFSLTKSHDQTEDIVQETFIKVWQKRDQVNPELNFKAWLFAIAKNQIIDAFRKSLRDPLFEDYLIYSSDENLSITSQEDSFDFDWFKEALREAKKKLSPRQEQVFRLCKELGYPPSQVAILLNISDQVVYNYLSQALFILRKELLK